MIFKEIPVGELDSFVNSAEFSSYNILPITKHRAYSQSINPRADKNDVVLIIAYENKNEIIGYVGALPDYLNGNKSQKVVWSSGWWVDKQKGKSVAIPLFLKMLEKWDKKMLFAHLTPTTKQILERLNIVNSKTVWGLRCFLRFRFNDILIQKFPSLKYLKLLLVFMDFVGNQLIKIRINCWKMRLKNLPFKIESINKLDDELNTFINDVGKKNIVNRDKDVLNWILKHKWILPKENDKEHEEKRYYFSSYSNTFKNLVYKISDNEKTIGLIFFTIRNRSLKIPYIYYNDDYLKDIINVIYKICLKFNVYDLIIYQQKIVELIKNKPSPFYLLKNTPRYIAATKELNIKEFNYQDGDGDVVFT
ncbi:MAG: hypothetical protein KAT68_15775 [Bacteroidales bacterium]|nr:hypothetical protein [Bacteroidales bacterium]